MKLNGIIIKAISGFYYVSVLEEQRVYECRARGVFRKNEVQPLVGDRVCIMLEEDEQSVVTEVLARKNEFVRPPIANLDQLFFLLSTCDPAPNYFVTDKLIAIAEHKGIEPILIITKSDMAPAEIPVAIYEKSGFRVLTVDHMDFSQNEAIRELLQGKISAFTGNSGVGKSTLLNNLFPALALKTGVTSQKLGRGKHTTRHVELFPLSNGGYVADTPGFSSVDAMQYGIIDKEELQFCFRDFASVVGKCKFTGCSHTVEKGCAVLKALEEGMIAHSRHESYVQMYRDAQQIKIWETKEYTKK